MDYESLCDYLESKPGVWRDMPFGADALVFKVFVKMFALVAWQAEPLSISLKADPIDAIILRKQYQAVRPGYHLNKKHWNTITINGSIPEDEIKLMIDDSYALVVQGMTKAQQARLKGLS